MPFHVAGEQAHEQVRSHPALLAMADGPYPDLEPLEGPEPALHVRKLLVGAHRVVARQPRCRLARAKHVEPVQTRFGLDPPGVALIAQPPVVDLPVEVLAHLVPPQHPPDLAPQLRRFEGLAGPARRFAGDPFEPRFGHRQQLLALARALLGQ